MNVVAFDPSAWSPATWAAAGVWLTLAVYTAIAFFAFRQVSEARALREEQARPFVVAEFVPGIIISFRVQNLGRTLARNVRLTWDEFPQVTSQFRDDPAWQSPAGSVLFSDGIPVLAPGQVVETLFDHFPQRTEDDLPMQHRITVSYVSFDGKRSYADAFDLDLKLFMGLRHIDRKDVHDVAQTLGKIESTLGRWSDGLHALRVNASDRNRLHAREERPWRITRARKTLREDGWAAMIQAQWSDFRRRHGLYSQ